MTHKRTLAKITAGLVLAAGATFGIPDRLLGAPIAMP